MAYQNKIAEVRRLIERINKLTANEISDKDKEPVLMEIANELLKVKIDEKLIENELSY